MVLVVGHPAGAYDNITYDCGNGESDARPDQPGIVHRETSDPLIQDFPPLTVTIGVNGHHYVRTYDWNDYDN